MGLCLDHADGRLIHTPGAAKKAGAMSNSGFPERLLGGKSNSPSNRGYRYEVLGFHDETGWTEMSESERKSFLDHCFAYDDELRRGGHFLGGEALQAAQHAATIRCRSGRVIVTDGPYAETKEQIGGILFLEARDLNHAIQLMSKHPGVRAGGFEIRPANEEINALIAARKT
jgi:hypothetical protein